MAVRRGESGEGALKAIFWLALLACVVVFVVKYVPVKIATAEFEDFMSEQAKFAQNASPDAIKKRILDRAWELRIPVEKEDCRVERRGDRILMECEYEIEVDFVVTKHTYKYHPQVDEPLFIF